MPTDLDRLHARLDQVVDGNAAILAEVGRTGEVARTTAERVLRFEGQLDELRQAWAADRVALEGRLAVLESRRKRGDSSEGSAPESRDVRRDATVGGVGGAIGAFLIETVRWVWHGLTGDGGS